MGEVVVVWWHKRGELDESKGEALSRDCLTHTWRTDVCTNGAASPEPGEEGAVYLRVRALK